MTDRFGTRSRFPGSRFGHPEVAVAIDMQPVRPREHALAEHRLDVAFGIEPDNGIEIGVVTVGLAAARRAVIATPQDRPQMLSVHIDIQTAGRRHFPLAELGPRLADAAWAFAGLEALHWTIRV